MRVWALGALTLLPVPLGTPTAVHAWSALDARAWVGGHSTHICALSLYSAVQLVLACAKPNMAMGSTAIGWIDVLCRLGLCRAPQHSLHARPALGRLHAAHLLGRVWPQQARHQLILCSEEHSINIYQKSRYFNFRSSDFSSFAAAGSPVQHAEQGALFNMPCSVVCALLGPSLAQQCSTLLRTKITKP